MFSGDIGNLFRLMEKMKDSFNQHLPNSTFAARTALLYGDI
jgi:hypothetical protein